MTCDCESNLKCEDCENHIRRGDEQYDRAEQLSKLYDQKQDAFNELADRLRERDFEVVSLRKLLAKSGIVWSENENHESNGKDLRESEDNKEA
jgi:hypothetical protein